MQDRKEEREPFSRAAKVLSWSSVVPVCVSPGPGDPVARSPTPCLHWCPEGRVFHEVFPFSD